MRRAVIAAIVGLVVAGGIGFYLWAAHGAGPPPPAIPGEVVDPPIRKVIDGKRQAVLASPRSAAAWGELGMAFAAHELTSEAMTCYRRAMELDPKDARWPYLLGFEFYSRGSDADREEAVRLYRQAADCPPPSPAHHSTALLSLADLLTELGRGDEAAPIYQQVYAADANNPWAAYRVGMLWADRDQTDKASQILLGLARSPYARKKSAIAMAQLSRRAGKAKDAEGFDYAASLLPPDAFWPNPYTAEMGALRRGRKALVNRCVYLEEAHQEKEGVNAATLLADLYPSVESQMMLLRALVNAKDYPAAVAVAEDILRDPEGRKLVNAPLFLGLARLGQAELAETEGRKADADKFFTQAADAFAESARLKADNAVAYLYRAKALLHLGRLKEAEEAARTGIHTRPEESEAFVILAQILKAQGRKGEALAAAEQAVKLSHPNDPRAKQALEALRK